MPADIADIAEARARKTASLIPDDTVQPHDPYPDFISTPLDPWPEPVAAGSLLAEVAETFRRHLILPTGAPEALALWVLFAHSLDAWQASPRLLITSPAPECGKTTLLEILRHLTPEAVETSGITPAAVFRIIDQCRPTLIIDEADTFFDKTDLKGILNSGHTRTTARIIRYDIKRDQARAFSTWAAIVIAKIGVVWPALASRSIEIRMRRRRPDEQVEPFKPARDAGVLERLNRMASRWVLDHLSALRESDPELPGGLDNRRRDNWVPLIAIADLAGGEWHDLAQRAALALAGSNEGQSMGVQLLGDIREVFAEMGCDRATSQRLVDLLRRREDRPWADHAGSGLTVRRLASLLSPFEIHPRVFRNGRSTPRGYCQEQFRDAFARYLPSPPEGSATPQQARNSRHFVDGWTATDRASVAHPSAVKPLETQ